MLEMSQKELDKLFQQGSEKYDFEYNTEAWVQMEDLLEKDKRRRFLTWWFFGSFALLLLIGAIYLFAQTTQKTQLNSTIEQKTITQNNTQESIKTQTSLSFIDSSLMAKKEHSLDYNAQFSNTNKEESKSISFEHTSEKEKANRQKKKPISKSPFTQLKNNDNPPLKLELTKSSISLEDDFNNNPNDAINDDGLKKLNSTKLSKLSLLDLTSLDYLEISSDFPELNFSVDSINRNQKKQEDEPKNKNSLFIGFVSAVELTSVKPDNLSKVSWKLGGQIEYRFLQKFGISLGANYIIKKYEAGTREYFPPQGFWTDAIAPQTVDAKCNILETPVLISYFPKKIGENGFFFNIGLTSYLMLREQYNYFYDQTVPNQVLDWTVENKNKHWFGIGQFSFGYQYFIKPKTLIQLFPYLQLPLTGVGHGQVKLWSVGISAKVNFQVL